MHPPCPLRPPQQPCPGARQTWCAPEGARPSKACPPACAGATLWLPGMGRGPWWCRTQRSSMAAKLTACRKEQLENKWLRWTLPADCPSQRMRWQALITNPECDICECKKTFRPFLKAPGRVEKILTSTAKNHSECTTCNVQRATMPTLRSIGPGTTSSTRFQTHHPVLNR